MKWLRVSLLAFAPLMVAPNPAAAGGCPNGFQLHALTDADHEDGQHQHAGVPADLVDLNGNGLICVRHGTRPGDIHVHIDDVLH